MYNTKYECRYNKNDIILPDEKVTKDEEDFIRNVLYQEDYENIFLINNYEEDDSNDKMDIYDKVVCNLYEKIKDSDVLKIFMTKAAGYLISEDFLVGLCILYSYDYMHLTHKCVSEYLDTGFISLDSIDQMNKSLK